MAHFNPLLTLTDIPLYITVLLLWCFESYLTRGTQIIPLTFPQVFGVCKALPNITFTFNANSLSLALPASDAAASTYMHICDFFRPDLL